MSRYIDENEVYKLVGETGIAKIHCTQIDDLPRADVKRVKHGKMILYGMFDDLAKCSICGAHGYTAEYASGFNYCPNCGAKMDGKESEA